MPARNFHGTLVTVGDKGVLITGSSGSGKSTLALKLIVTGMTAGFPAKLVSDDQLFLSVRDGALHGEAPAAIAGLIEVRGVGPTGVDHVPSSTIDLMVRLVPKVEAPRMNEERTEMLSGVAVPVLDLEAGNTDGAMLAILAWLKLGPFAAR